MMHLVVGDFAKRPSIVEFGYTTGVPCILFSVVLFRFNV